MITYNFTLLPEGRNVLEPAVLDALYAAGCTDASLGEQGGRQFAEFDRDGPTLVEAVRSAIEDMEGAVPGLRVRRVEVDDLVSASDIANRIGRSRESISQIIAGERGPGTFPQPATRVGGKRPLWGWPEVSKWFAEYTGQPASTTTQHDILAAVNALLDLRRYSTHIGSMERQALAMWAEDSTGGLGTLGSPTASSAEAAPLEIPTSTRAS